MSMVKQTLEHIDMVFMEIYILEYSLNILILSSYTYTYTECTYTSTYYTYKLFLYFNALRLYECLLQLKIMRILQ